MAALIPFRSLRPSPEAAAHVAAVPYDVVSTDEAHAIAKDNPLSFLHVSRAEIDLPQGTDPHSEAVYARAVSNLQSLTKMAPLVRDETTSVYVYRLRMGSHVQTGVAACFSLDEYDRDIIKKHERTRRDKEDDRTTHMLALRAQTGPVFLTYRARPAVDAIVTGVTEASPPLFDFIASDGVQHTVWLLDAATAGQDLVTAFAAIPALYIADGHHRAASAARVRQHLRGASAQAGEWDTVLAVAFPHDQVQILPYNRVITDLAGLTPAAFLQRLRERFTVIPGNAEPDRRGTIAMFVDGGWYRIVLGAVGVDGPPDQRLDVSRLQDLVLTPLLGIGDVRTDKRIDFVGGGRGTGELESRVRSGHAAVAFSLFPVSVEDLIAIADAGGIMPPKSTWFEPKLRDGLLVHVI